jgi:hypothetical protein
VTTAKTPEERERNARYQREFRARRAEQQSTEVRGIFAHPDDHAEVKEAAAKIARRRARARARSPAA